MVFWRSAWEIRMPLITIPVKGVDTTKEVEPRTLWSTFIREEMKLTGTHVGSDTS